MKVVIQRVTNANVSIKNEIINEISNGYLILVGFAKDDTIKDIDYIINKIFNLRILDDDNKIMNLSILEKKYEILSISQFTLLASTKKGRRPNYNNAMEEKKAIEFYELFNRKLKESKLSVKTGIFKENMQISLTNDGPVTIIIDTNNK